MRKKNSKSISDIANALNINISTVSRALRKQPSISAETTRKVLREAQRQGYFKKECKNVVIVIPQCTIANYDLGILNALQSKLNASNISWEIIDAGNVNIIPERLIHGIISLDFRDQKSSQLINICNLPIVAINEEPNASGKVYSVRSDARNGMMQAMTFLKKLGHKKVIYLHRNPENYCSKNRKNAFDEIAKTLGNVVWQTQMVYIFPDKHDDFMKLFSTIMKNGFSAAIIEGETSSIYACNHLLRAGIAIPEKISIVGWESPGLSEYMNPALTAIGQDFDALADATVNTLNIIWEGGNPPLNQELPYRFFERESTVFFES